MAARKAGSDGFHRARIAEIQRARILAAVLDVSAKRGAANVTVAPVVERAGVSRRTFYELFSDCEECLLAAIDEAIERLAGAVVPAWQRETKWRERIRAALVELLTLLEQDAVTGRLLVVDTLGAGRRALERRRAVLEHAIEAVDSGRHEAASAARTSELTAEGIVGGVMSVLHSHMLDGAGRSLLELTSPLMSMIVLPYLGPAAARRELERPAPERPKGAPAAEPVTSEDPLRGVGMRLTARTMLVLSAIADEPGASNRRVGRTAGIEDQGQISKLLARLQRLGLIGNDSDGLARGMPNAWTLTPKGERVHRMMAAPQSRGEERWYRAARDAG